MNLEALDAALLAAHRKNDLVELAALYRKAGLSCIAANDVDAGCFYLTHAYIFALACGLPEAGEIHSTLVAHGREQ